MNRRRVAATLGLLGAALGVIAGAVQAAVGPHIPDVTGHKANPVALGLLTILLSGIGLLCATRLHRTIPLPPGPRATAVIGLLVPGGLCFTTAGILWYLPGLLLLGAAIIELMADWRGFRAVVAENWSRVLVSLLGAFELLMAVSAAPPTTMIVGLLGGLSLLASPWQADMRFSVVLLLVGTLPFALLTWWSLASPLLAILAIAIGLTTARADHSRKGRIPGPHVPSPTRQGTQPTSSR